MNALAAINEAVLQEQLYKLSSTQINLPAAHADYLIKWGREMIPNEQLYYDDKGGLGREDEPHISVLYGLTDPKPSEELLALIRKTPPFTVKLTSVTLFDNNPDYDVVKFDVDSDELKALSDAIRQACPNENKFPVFHGHATIAYVKKGRVPDLAGNYPFQQNPPIPADFEVNEIIFKPAGESEDPKRVPIRIPLNRYRKEAEDPKAVMRQFPRHVFVLRSTSDREGEMWVRWPLDDANMFPMVNFIHFKDGAHRFGSRMEVEAQAKAYTDAGYPVEIMELPVEEAEDPKTFLKKIAGRTDKLCTICRKPTRNYVTRGPTGRMSLCPDCYKGNWEEKLGLPRWESEDPKRVFKALSKAEKKAKEDKNRKENGGVLMLPAVRGRLQPAWNVRRMGEAEDPKGLLKLQRITRPLMFWQVPEGFYFRTASYPLVKKQQVDEWANAVTTDLDAVRALSFKARDWVMPPGWMIDDITSGKKLEALLERGVTVVQEGLDEAEDAKTVLRLAKAAADDYYVSRGADAYGQDLRHTHYLRIAHGAPAWTTNYMMATCFSSDEQARRAFQKLLPGQFDVMKASVHTRKKKLAWEPDRYHEAETPKGFIRTQAPRFVIYSRDTAGTWFFRRESRPGWETYTWVQSPHGATQFVNKEDAEAAFLQHRMGFQKEETGIGPINRDWNVRESKQRDPFDLLKFPTDAAGLAAKLLELEHGEMSTVL